MSPKPWCPWCFDLLPESDAAAEVEAGPSVGNPGRIISWRCKRCGVSLSAKKWARAMEWAARFSGIGLEEIAPDIERALGVAR
jgi:hypothetical protein